MLSDKIKSIELFNVAIAVLKSKLRLVAYMTQVLLVVRRL